MIYVAKWFSLEVSRWVKTRREVEVAYLWSVSAVKGGQNVVERRFIPKELLNLILNMSCEPTRHALLIYEYLRV